MKIKAVLWDMDGTLVPTESLRDQAHQATVKHFGGRIAGTFYREIGGAGLPHEVVRQEFIRQSGIAVGGDEYTRVFRHYLRQFFPTLKPNPGVLSILQAQKHKRLRMAVVSTSQSAEVKDILVLTRLMRYFEAVVSGEDISHPKPAPDPYLRALTKLGIEANHAVAIEDSEVGLRSALAAGIRTIAFRHDYNRNHDFSGAALEINSFEPAWEVLNKILKSA